MNASGVVQSVSTVGFETLYAGYRFDGITPQMYYVRNRFLLPMVGTWNRRDPLGYVDGMNLYFLNATINTTDPTGETPFVFMPEVTVPPPNGGPVGGPPSFEASVIKCRIDATRWYSKCISKPLHNSVFCVLRYTAHLDWCLAVI